MKRGDGSTHEWAPGQRWDLIITLDEAASEHHSTFFVEEEGTASSFQAMAEIIETQGLPSSLYTEACALWGFSPNTPLAGDPGNAGVSPAQGCEAPVNKNAGETPAFPGSRASAAVG